MDISEPRKQLAIKLANEIYDLVDQDCFDRMSLGSIEEAFSKLQSLGVLYGTRNAEIEAAKSYLEKMKRPRADRYQLGSSLKDMVYGLRISSHNL